MRELFSGSRRRQVVSLGPPLTPAVRGIILVTVACYLLMAVDAVRDFELQWLVLHPNMVLDGCLWQLATYLLVHSPSRFDHIVWNLLPLWFFGCSVESSWGSRRFLWYYILTGVGAGLCAMLTGNATLGASGAVYGVMVAFAMLFPDEIINVFYVIPMKAWHAVMLFIAIQLAMLLNMPGGGISYAAHLGGAAVGYLYCKYSWRLQRMWRQSPQAPRPRVISIETRARGRGREPMPPPPSIPPSQRPAPSAQDIAIQKRADEVLDKISREGMASLTREEREILQRQSEILKARESDVVNLDDYRS